jgi:creatinine amidohydrolase
MTRLTSLTWADAESAFATASLAILPTGSIEQHGPHMTLESDTAVAWALAQRLEVELGPDAVLLPRLDYGLSEHHLRFPGTMTLRPETYVRLLVEIVESVTRWGMRRVLIVNGHGGNIDALRLVSRIARRDHGALVASVMWAVIAADEIKARVSSPQYGHACESETSIALALAPEVVLRDRIGEPGGRHSVDPFTDPPRSIVDQTVLVHEWTDDGALGDARLASEDLGRVIADVAATRTLDFARRFMRQPLPSTGGES